MCYWIYFYFVYIFIIMFVTGVFTFSCVFSRCHLFLFMISPCSVFTQYDLGYWRFFRNIPFLFHFSCNFILTLSFGFSIGNSSFFLLLLFVCFFKYIMCFMLGRFVRIILFITCTAGNGDTSFKGVVLSDSRAKYRYYVLSYAFVRIF